MTIIVKYRNTYYWSFVSFMIHPDEIFLYNYSLKDVEETLEITIPMPDGFDSDSIKVEFLHNNQCINVSAGDRIPFVCGIMYKPIESYVTKTENQKFIITLTKKEKELWPVFITSNNVETLAIDPKSAFIIYDLFQRNPNEEDAAVAFQYLFYSAKAGFVPAMRVYGKYLARDKETLSSAIQVLSLGMEMYGDAECQFNLALIYSNFERMKDKAAELMVAAAEAGLPDAMVGAGEFFSPLSNIKYAKKDVSKALIWFNKALEHGENWIAYHELAKLNMYGVGVQKNVNRARELQAMAQKLHGSVPPLELANNGEGEKKPAGPSIKKNLVNLGITCAFAAIFGFAVYKSVHKKK